MMTISTKITGRVIYLLLAVVLGLASRAGAAQESTQGPQAPPDQMLKERATAYYQALAKGDKMTAYGFVAPESKNDFFATGNLAPDDIRILGFDMSDGAGDMARVKIQESVTPPLFQAPVDFQMEESWKRIDGDWFIVLPSTKDMESPFGKMSFDKQATQKSTAQGTTANSVQNPAPNLDEIKKRVQKSMKNADPDEYLLTLKKAQIEAQAGKDKDPKDKNKDVSGEKNSDPAAGQQPK
jgi:hypothetical protein